jgi:hypothetical protein
MAMSAQRVEQPVEERIARLESHVEHIQSDVTEIKGDIRRLDQKFEGKLERLEGKIEQRFETLDNTLVEFRLATEQSFSKLRIWGLSLYIAQATVLLGVMAKGFGWIH